MRDIEAGAREGLRAIGARLKEERLRQELDQAEFASLGGVGRTSQVAYEAGKSPPAADYFLKLAAHHVDVGYVLTGARQLTPDIGTKIEELNLQMIPEVDITYSMGAGAVVDEHVESRMVPFRRDWLQRLTRGGPADVFLTRGQGDSMMPTILDDDDVLVNRADSAVRQQDRIWAVGYGDFGMIKRVRRRPTGIFELNSDNPNVRPIEATEDELFIVGRIIWIGRRV